MAEIVVGLILVVIFGLIGARLYHVIFSQQPLVRGFDCYCEHPGQHGQTG